MNTKQLKGTLKPSNPEATVFNIAHYIYKALAYNQLSNAIYDGDRWDKGIIEVDTTFGAYGNETIGTTLTEESLKIVESIANFVKAEKVADLGLQGVITLTLENSKTREVNTVRITVSREDVTYQQAGYVWTEAVTVQ